MDIDEILEKKMPEAIDYASRIIYETQTFIDFAIALTDYMGETFIPYCKSVYIMLRSFPHDEKLKFESDEILAQKTPEIIIQEFRDFKREQVKRQRQQEFKENIDELQFLVADYRESSNFKKLLEFIGRFKYLAPYNAMLVQMQKPGATFVFSGKKWEKYGRKPCVNGQKLIILKPFGPIQCVFDYGDTEPIQNADYSVTETELMKIWDQSLTKAQGNVPKETMENLYHNLPYYGIYLDETFLAANTYGGYIMPYSDRVLTLKLGKDQYIKLSSKFIISINSKQKDAVKFHTICHELGHLFCYHQSYNPTKRRQLSLKEREFEAETVAWLVCKRYGIENPSEEYLAGYAPHGEIPICSTDLMMRAVTEIEKMLQGEMKVKDSLWYKEDSFVKNQIMSFLKKAKTQKDLFGNPIDKL